MPPVSEAESESPGGRVRLVGRAVTASVARAPWLWPLLRGPMTRYFDDLAVGQAQGATRAYVMSETSAQELPLREPRSNGIAVALPTGHVAVVGGSVSGEPTRSIELFAEP